MHYEQRDELVLWHNSRVTFLNGEQTTWSVRQVFAKSNELAFLDMS